MNSVSAPMQRDRSSFVQRHGLILFFVIAYAFSWLLFLPIVVAGAPMQFTIPASLGPSVAALIVHRMATGNYRAFRLYTGIWQTLGVAAIGAALIVLTYVVLPGVTTADPRKLNWGILASTAVYNYSTVLAGPLGEEPGWRGFALPRLEARFGPIAGSLVLAVLWAAWHTPLFFVATWSSAPVWIYTLILMGLSMIMTFGANLARFGVIPSILMHAAFNTVSRFLGGLFRDTQPEVNMRFELVLALCGLAMAAVIVAATRGRLGYSRELRVHWTNR